MVERMKTTQLGAALNSLCILTTLIAKALTGFLLMCLAVWIQRLARFLDKSEPGPLFIVVLGCIIGFILGFFEHDMRHVELNVPLYQSVWYGIVVCFKFGATGLILLYFMWEVIQGCKWLFKWAEQYQRRQFKINI